MFKKSFLQDVRHNLQSLQIAGNKFSGKLQSPVTGCFMPLFPLLKYRSFLPAAVCCIGTAGMEFAS